MALFRVDFSGRGELAERQQKLAQMLSRLQKISEGQLCSISKPYHRHHPISQLLVIGTRILDAAQTKQFIGIPECIAIYT